MSSQAHLYNPPDEAEIAVHFAKIGSANDSVEPWNSFGKSIKQHVGVHTFGNLRKAREKDVDEAVTLAKLRVGYKCQLCDYMTPLGAPAFTFDPPPTEFRPGSTNGKGIFTKRLESQRDRPSIGRELGLERLAELTLPENIFDSITWCGALPMKSKGPNSTESVADILYTWVIAQWGNAHMDALFAERMEQLLTKRWPKLAPWGKNGEHPRPRRWSQVIQNRFANVRECKVRPRPPPPPPLKPATRPYPLCRNSSPSRDAQEGAYKKLAISSVDLSSPARLLVADGLRVKVKEGAPSMYDALKKAAESDESAADDDDDDDVPGLVPPSDDDDDEDEQPLSQRRFELEGPQPV